MLRPFFEWMDRLGIYGGSTFIGPGLNIIHLMGMVVFLGAILIVDLRLLGTGLTRQPTASVARDAQPWLIGGLVVLVLTGMPATIASATDQYFSSVFWARCTCSPSGWCSCSPFAAWSPSRKKVASRRRRRRRSGSFDRHLAGCRRAGAADHDAPARYVRMAGGVECVITIVDQVCARLSLWTRARANTHR